ncbi:MAG: hypothetical protein JWO09_3509 [Bacteroidetes bacterium]|nr:hypothetical protein [Bacteroidota bacterium]
MKPKVTLFSTAIFILFLSQAFAQPEKGDRIFEGSIGNLSYTMNKPDVTYNPYYTNYRSYDLRASIYPGIGYFFSDRLAGGFVLDGSYSNSSTQSDWILSQNNAINNRFVSFNLLIVPYCRYYFAGKKTNRFYAELHFGGGGGISDSRSETTYSSTNNGVTRFHSHGINNQWTTGLMIGFNHFFTKNIAFQTVIGPDYTVLHGTVNYSYYANPAQSLDIINGNLNFSWKFGFSILLPSKKKKDAPAAG